jgi:hypothetical protein
MVFDRFEFTNGSKQSPSAYRSDTASRRSSGINRFQSCATDLSPMARLAAWRWIDLCLLTLCNDLTDLRHETGVRGNFPVAQGCKDLIINPAWLDSRCKCRPTLLQRVIARATIGSDVLPSP